MTGRHCKTLGFLLQGAIRADILLLNNVNEKSVIYIFFYGYIELAFRAPFWSGKHSEGFFLGSEIKTKF